MGQGEEGNRTRAAGSPRGIEVLVKKASVDPAFRAILLERRAKAADEIGLALTPAEAAMIDSIPADQLAAIIARTKVDPAHRHAFLGKVALAMLAAGVGVVVYGGATTSLGNRPGGIVEGIRPDVSAPAQPGTQPSTQPKTDNP